jgi:hypothetical protein
VPEGRYNVKLHFAEIWDGAFGEGKRVFDVSVNGTAAAQALDIFARVGARKPLVVEAEAQAQEGRIAVEFANAVNHAKISGIEILAAEPVKARGAGRPGVPGQARQGIRGSGWQAIGIPGASRDLRGLLAPQEP